MQASSERDTTIEAPAREPSAVELLLELDTTPEPNDAASRQTAARETAAVDSGADARPIPAPSAGPALGYGNVIQAAPLTIAMDSAAMDSAAIVSAVIDSAAIDDEKAPAHARLAKRAKSCLVAPELDDRVLCSFDGAEVYVLAVLDGAPDTRLVADGDLKVRAEGELSLSSATRITATGPAVEIAADALTLRAKAAKMALDELRVLGRSVEVHMADKAQLLAERVDARASRFLQRAKQVFRFAEQLEQVRVGHYDLRADGVASMRGENTIVTARVLAKLDGEQVKIG